MREGLQQIESSRCNGTYISLLCDRLLLLLYLLVPHLLRVLPSASRDGVRVPTARERAAGPAALYWRS